MTWGRRRSASNDGAHGGAQRILGVSYNTAFRILGPTPRKVRVEPKKGGRVKYPDEAVREARKLAERMTQREAALALQDRWPGIPESWVCQVVDGVIRSDVV